MQKAVAFRALSVISTCQYLDVRSSVLKYLPVDSVSISSAGCAVWDGRALTVPFSHLTDRICIESGGGHSYHHSLLFHNVPRLGKMVLDSTVHVSERLSQLASGTWD